MSASSLPPPTPDDTAAPPPVSFAALCCPPLGKPLEALHPRVYLMPDDDGRAVCPYCGACRALADVGQGATAAHSAAHS